MNKNLELAHKRRQEMRENGEEVVRLNPIEKARANPASLRAAINGKCWDCTCGQRSEIRECPITDCTLHNLRPYQK